jgi:hypothetical protein
MKKNVLALISKGAADDRALAGYDVLGTRFVDVVFQVETKYFNTAQST